MNLKYKYELEKILKSESINTVFQPIISLENGSVIGYEALSRGPEDSPLHLPENLFSTAEDCDRIWELELLCRVKAIERAKMIDKNKLLFINVDPKIFKDERFRKGFTRDFLKKHNMSPNLIIFEITEKTAIEDYKSFKIALNNYVNQGYKIAIDDMGTGYSGLKTLMETKPHYIKIDISFISGIDKDEFKQELVKNFVSLAHLTNMKIIAEGIETEKELLKLINLGVSAGQGYLLQRPYKNFLDISEDIKKKIIKYNNIRQNQLKSETSYIGNIVQKNLTFPSTASNKQVKRFLEFSGVTGVCIVKDNYPIGLIMQHNLDYILATQYGNSVFLKRPASLIMDSSPLIFDYYNTISNVSKIAMSRDSKRIYDYVIVTKENKYCGIVTIKNLLEYTVKFEKNNAKNLNPLTGLPGNKIINRTLNNILNCDSNFFLIYADLNNFKVIKMSKEYQNDGIKIKSYIKNFYVLTDDINSSQQQISNVINSITDSVGKCTDAAINILDNMNSIEHKNADISLDTVENANNAKKLIDIVDQFKVKIK